MTEVESLQLAAVLFYRWPATWLERLKSYENGTNADLKAWRALGKRRAA